MKLSIWRIFFRFLPSGLNWKGIFRISNWLFLATKVSGVSPLLFRGFMFSTAVCWECRCLKKQEKWKKKHFLKVTKSTPQHAEWDLNKTSKTLTGSPLGLIFMLYGWKKNIVWNPRLKGKFLKIPGRGIEPGTLKITTVGHPSKYWIVSTQLNFSVRSLKLSSVEPSQYLDGWPPVVIFRVPGSIPRPGIFKKLPLLRGFQTMFIFNL